MIKKRIVRVAAIAAASVMVSGLTGCATTGATTAGDVEDSSIDFSKPNDHLTRAQLLQALTVN